MTRIIKFLISLIFFVYLKLKQIFMKLFGLNISVQCITLYYHSIYKNEINSFNRQMELLSRKTITIHADYFGKLSKNKLYSIITFDDAFENLITNAVPTLEKYKLPFTIFFITDYFGKTPGWEIPEYHSDKNQKIMSIEQMKQLPQDLLTVGSHTVNHCKLTTLTDSEINFELNESKKRLEEISGKEVSTISFPNGEYNKSILTKSFEAGYKRAFTIEPKFSLTNRDENISGRVWVNGSDWYPEFWLKIHGGYCWLNSFFEFKRKYFA